MCSFKCQARAGRFFSYRPTLHSFSCKFHLNYECLYNSSLVLGFCFVVTCVISLSSRLCLRLFFSLIQFAWHLLSISSVPGAVQTQATPHSSWWVAECVRWAFPSFSQIGQPLVVKDLHMQLSQDMRGGSHFWGIWEDFVCTCG